MRLRLHPGEDGLSGFEMNRPPDVATLVAEELAARGWFPDGATYDVVFDAALRTGRETSEHIRTMVGPSRWNRMVSRYGFADAEVAFHRILGIGEALTGFMTAPLDLTPRLRTKLRELGSLANFIATLYDHFLDRGRMLKLLPVVIRMRSIRRSRPRSRFRLRQLAPLEARFLLRLISEYLERLEGLERRYARSSIRDTVLRAILRAFRANQALARQPGPGSPRRLAVEKAALPLVVMGLPGWLVVPRVDERAYWRHLRWMYRMGDYLGWIDDSVDVLEDRQKRHPNRVLEELGANAGGDAAADLAERIADRGAAVSKGWETLMNDQNLSCSADVSAVLSVCVASWLGRRRNLATRAPRASGC